MKTNISSVLAKGLMCLAIVGAAMATLQYQTPVEKISPATIALIQTCNTQVPKAQLVQVESALAVVDNLLQTVKATPEELKPVCKALDTAMHAVTQEDGYVDAMFDLQKQSLQVVIDKMYNKGQNGHNVFDVAATLGVSETEAVILLHQARTLAEEYSTPGMPDEEMQAPDAPSAPDVDESSPSSSI